MQRLGGGKARELYTVACKICWPFFWEEDVYLFSNSQESVISNVLIKQLPIGLMRGEVGHQYLRSRP
jgi:hypothetical protein